MPLLPCIDSTDGGYASTMTPWSFAISLQNVACQEKSLKSQVKMHSQVVSRSQRLQYVPTQTNTALSTIFPMQGIFNVC